MSVISEELGYKAPFQQVKRKFFSLNYPNKIKTGEGGLVFPYTIEPVIALRADQGVGKTDAVNSWVSGDSENRVFSASGANRPTFEDNVFGTLPGIKSDMAAEGLVCTTTAPGVQLAGTGATIFILYRLDDASDDGFMIGTGTSGTSHNFWVFHGGLSTPGYWQMLVTLPNTTDSQNGFLGTDDEEIHILECFYDISGNEHSVWRDGVFYKTDSSYSDLPNQNDVTFCCPGNRDPATEKAQQALACTVGAFFYWDSLLSSADRTLMRNWLDDLAGNTIL